MASVESENQRPFKQCLSVLEKKVRNLEKRKGKLDSYRELSAKGQELNKDQKEAVSKYDDVIQNLEFARDLHKQFITINVDADKQQKKQAKRDRMERQHLELSRLQDLVILQNILNALGAESIREELQAGKYPTLVLGEDQLVLMDEFYQLIVPSRELDTRFNEQIVSASEHIQCYLDRSDKKVSSTTYKELRELVERIHSSGYFSSTASALSNCIVEKEAANAVTAEESTIETASLDNEPGSTVEGESEDGSSRRHADGEVSSARDTPVSDVMSAAVDRLSVSDRPSAAVSSTALPSAAAEAVAAVATVIAPVNGMHPVVYVPTSASAPAPTQTSHWSNQQLVMIQASQESTMRGGAVTTNSNATVATASSISAPMHQLHAQQQQLANAATAAPVAAGLTGYDSFYAVNPPSVAPGAFGRTRPLTDIVSSMQGGSFNFLQESQIDADMDPAIVAVMPMSQVQSSGVATAASNVYAAQHAAVSSAPPVTLEQQRVSSTVHPSPALQLSSDMQQQQQQQEQLYQQQILQQHQQQQFAQLQQQQQQNYSSAVTQQENNRFNTMDQNYTPQELVESSVQPNQYSFIDQQSFHNPAQISSVINPSATGVNQQATHVSVNSSANQLPESSVNHSAAAMIPRPSSSRTEITFHQQQLPPTREQPMTMASDTGSQNKPVSTVEAQSGLKEASNKATADNVATTHDTSAGFASGSSNIQHGNFQGSGSYARTADYNGGCVNTRGGNAGGPVYNNRTGAGPQRGSGGSVSGNTGAAREQQFANNGMQRGAGGVGVSKVGIPTQYNGNNRSGGGGSYPNGGGFNGPRGGGGGYSRGGSRGSNGGGSGGYYGPPSSHRGGPGGARGGRPQNQPMMQH